MKIKVIVIGKLKEKYLKDAEAEYLKRLKPYLQIELIELQEHSGKDGVSLQESELLMDKEWYQIEKYIQQIDIVWVLDVHGKIISSEQLAEKIETWKTWDSSTKDLVVVIGGPSGISRHLRNRANWLWSMSKLTFTHQFVRVLLFEQLYRSEKIQRREPYHK